jgi:hypothetical protein
MRQDRSTPITETAEEPTGCGPDGYRGFAHHHRSVLDHRRTRASPVGVMLPTLITGQTDVRVSNETIAHRPLLTLPLPTFSTTAS